MAWLIARLGSGPLYDKGGGICGGRGEVDPEPAFMLLAEGPAMQGPPRGGDVTGGGE
jgi:hypothetical protein